MADEKELDRALEEHIAELPPYVREAIAKSDIERKLQNLGEKHRLHIDQQAILGRETLMAMLGIAGHDDVVNYLTNEARIPEEVSRALVADIEQDILLPIREAMKRADEEETLEADEFLDEEEPSIEQPSEEAAQNTRPATQMSKEPPTTPGGEEAQESLGDIDSALAAPTGQRVGDTQNKPIPPKPTFNPKDPYLEPIE